MGTGFLRILLSGNNFPADRLVHESVAADDVLRHRHASFIRSHLIGGFLALPAFVLYLLLDGPVNLLSVSIFAWAFSPFLIAILLSQTGRLEVAHLASVVCLAGVVGFAMSLTGGIESPFGVWMILLPIEAALSGSRKVVVLSVGVTIAAFAFLYLLTDLGMLPAQHDFGYGPEVIAYFAAITACVYGASLATTIDRANRLAEEKLRRNAEWYRLLGENASDLIMLHDSEGQVLFASPAAQSIFGVQSNALMGDGFLGRVQTADRKNVERVLRLAAVDEGLFAARFRVGVVGSSDQRAEWGEINCQLVDRSSLRFLPEGSHVVSVTRDITQQQAQKLALEDALETARGADRMKSQFLARISHEFKTPLNAVIGFSKVLERDLGRQPNVEDQLEYLSHVRQGGEQLAKLVDDVLDIVKLEAGTKRIVTAPIDIGRIVEASVVGFAAECEERGILLDVDMERNIGELSADNKMCHQMLEVLIENAVQSARRKIEIKVRADKVSGDVVISVTDDGDGFSEAELPAIERPFAIDTDCLETGKNGLGLGLSRVKGFMGLHKGRFNIESKSGFGTRMELCFPCRLAGSGGVEYGPKDKASTVRGKSGRSAA